MKIHRNGKQLKKYHRAAYHSMEMWILVVFRPV